MDLIQHHVQAGRADLAGEEAVRLVQENSVHSLVPFLSGLLSLRGQPFTLDNHYQFEPLFSAYLVNSTVFKTGRQIGKCRPLRSTDTVSALNGRPLSPGELVVGTEILSVDENLRIVPARVTRVSRFGRESIFAVKTRCGSEVSFNGPHPLRTYAGFTPVEKMKPGDRVASISVGGRFGSVEVCDARVVLTAYLIGDGCCRRENVSFTSACEETLTEYSEALRRMAPSLPVRRQKSKSAASDIFTRREHPIVGHLIEDGLIGKYAYEKRMPAWVFDLDREKSALFLSRLWATDGTVKRRGASVDISYCTTSKGLSRDVRALLTKFGIRSSITKRAAFAKASDGTRKRGRDAYVVRVETRPSWRRFHDEIRVPGKPPFDLPTTAENSNRDSVPDDSFADIAEMARPTKWKRAGVSSLLSAGLRVTPKYALSRAKAAKYLEHFDDLRGSDPHQRLYNAVNGDVYWDEVTSVEREDDDVVWDIEVEGTHTYVIDGLVSHNTISMIGSSAVRCGLIPDYRIMYVTPLFSQVQRLSNEVARPILRESPIGHLMSGTRAEESVLRRTFFNRSRMEFTFASLTADRTRGATNDELDLDEIQDLKSDHLPVILETLSASKYGIVRKFGTPKTPENIIEGEWRKSSQGVWCIPCPYCKKQNFACLSHDLERMIGPYHPDISENRPGTVCAAAGCARPISPRDGFWVHRYPQRRGTAAGYHVPQPIMSLHYSSPDKWARLLQKRDSTGLYTPARYQNEVLGESAGEGLQLVTRDELQRASDETRPNYPHDPRRVLKNLDYHRYKLIFLSVDWGGGGESGLSLTVPVVLGMRHDGRIEVIYACRLRTPNDHLKEAQEVLEIFRLFRCQRLVHDYTGAGALRETVMVASGVDRRVLVPIQYVGGGATNLMTRVASTQRSIRTYYRLNKSRSLLYTISAIRTRLVRFFAYDYVDAENPGLIEDFLALYEERIEHKSGSNIYVIDRNQAMTDDFAQALNIGCAAMWFMTKSWPTFDVVPDEYKKYILTTQQEADLEPPHPWADAIATEGLEGFDDA